MVSLESLGNPRGEANPVHTSFVGAGEVESDPLVPVESGTGVEIDVHTVENVMACYVSIAVEGALAVEFATPEAISDVVYFIVSISSLADVKVGSSSITA